MFNHNGEQSSLASTNPHRSEAVVAPKNSVNFLEQLLSINDYSSMCATMRNCG